MSSGGRRASRLLAAALAAGALPVLTACLAAAPRGVRAAAAQLVAGIVAAPRYTRTFDPHARGGSDDSDDGPDGDGDGGDDDDARIRRSRYGRYGAHDGPGLMAVAADDELLAVLTYVAQRDTEPTVR